MDAAKLEYHTIEEVMALPEGQRAELIDGLWFDMAAPSTTHQRLVTLFTYALHSYIKEHGGKCKVMPAPFGVFLNEERNTYLEPDVSVVCDDSKLDEKGCHGAPDLVIEITSPSTMSKDYVYKLQKYQEEGVREYWIVDPAKKSVFVYDFTKPEEEGFVNIMGFDDEISTAMFPELKLETSKEI